MLKTILMAVVGFSLLWLALVAEVAAHECGDYLSPSLSGTAQKSLCAEVASSITEEDIRAPRYHGAGTVEGTMPSSEPVSPRVTDYRGIQGHVVDYRTPKKAEDVWRPKTDAEIHAELIESIRRHRYGGPCHVSVRSHDGLPPCGPLDKAMVREGLE